MSWQTPRRKKIRVSPIIDDDKFAIGYITALKDLLKDPNVYTLPWLYNLVVKRINERKINESAR